MAVNNWEKRTQYLLTEIIKYETYMDSLKASMEERAKRRVERAKRKAERAKRKAERAKRKAERAL